MNEITIGDKIYISAKRAAEITGYARDYVGQLCREGHVDAKMVGRSWYVYEPSIRTHRFGAEEVETENATEKPEIPSADKPQEAPDGWERPIYTAETLDTLPEIQVPRIEELLPPAEESLTDMQTAWREWFEQKQKVLETPEIESPEVIDARNEAPEANEEPTEMEEEQEVNIVRSNTTQISDEDIPLHRIAEAPEDEEIVAIHHIAPPPVPTYRPVVGAHMDIAPEPVPVYVPHSAYAELAADYSREEIAQEHQGRIVEERVIPAKKAKSGRTRKERRPRRTNAPIIAVLVAVSIISLAIAAIGTGYANRYLKTLPAKNNPVINFLIGTRQFNR